MLVSTVWVGICLFQEAESETCPCWQSCMLSPHLGAWPLPPAPSCHLYLLPCPPALRPRRPAPPFQLLTLFSLSHPNHRVHFPSLAGFAASPWSADPVGTEADPLAPTRPRATGHCTASGCRHPRVRLCGLGSVHSVQVDLGSEVHTVLGLVTSAGNACGEGNFFKYIPPHCLLWIK